MVGVPGVCEPASAPAPKTKGAPELAPNAVGDRVGLATGENVNPKAGAVGVAGCTAPVPNEKAGGGSVGELAKGEDGTADEVLLKGFWVTGLANGDDGVLGRLSENEN